MIIDMMCCSDSWLGDGVAAIRNRQAVCDSAAKSVTDFLLKCSAVRTLTLAVTHFLIKTRDRGRLGTWFVQPHGHTLIECFASERLSESWTRPWSV